jgi:cell division protein FtsB
LSGWDEELAQRPTPCDLLEVLRRRPAAKSKAAKSAKAGRRRALIIERILPIGLLTLALVGAPLMIFSREGMPRLEAVEKELDTVERENDELRREIDLLRVRVAKLRDDPATVEQLARDELGLIRHTEVVFQFPE